MPITSSAKKALRSSIRKKAVNSRRKEAMKSLEKEARKFAQNGESGDSKDMLARAFQAIDKAAKRGIIKPNTAARKKSRIALALRNAAAK